MCKIKIDSEKDLKKSLDSKIAKVANGWVSGECGTEEKIQGCLSKKAWAGNVEQKARTTPSIKKGKCNTFYLS